MNYTERELRNELHEQAQQSDREVASAFSFGLLIGFLACVVLIAAGRVFGLV